MRSVISLISCLTTCPFLAAAFIVNAGFMVRDSRRAPSFIDQQSIRNFRSRQCHNIDRLGAPLNTADSILTLTTEGHSVSETLFLGSPAGGFHMASGMDEANTFHTATRARRQHHHSADSRRPFPSRGHAGLSWLEQHESQSLLDDRRDLRDRVGAGASPGLDHFNAIMNKCAGSVSCPAVGARGELDGHLLPPRLPRRALSPAHGGQAAGEEELR